MPVTLPLTLHQLRGLSRAVTLPCGVSVKRSTLPKYAWINNEISALIQKGKLAVGGLVPSENGLIRQYSVGNTFARKVLQETERAGWVVRLKGKGPFVRQKLCGEGSAPTTKTQICPLCNELKS